MRPKCFDDPPPFYVSYSLDPDSEGDVYAEDLGKFETEEAVYAAVAEDSARRTGIDLAVIKKVQAALGRYSVMPF